MISIKKPRQIDLIFLFVYATYLLEIGNMKYVLAMFFAFLYIVIMASRDKRLVTKESEKMFVIILCSIVILAFITLLLQLWNGFQKYAINEVIYFITPLGFVWIFVNNSDENRMEKMLDYMFAVAVSTYIIRIIPDLTMDNLKEMSLRTSYSVFESGYGFTMIVFEWLYLYKKEKKKALLALVLCLLSFKRFNMLAAIVMFLFSKKLITRNRVSNWTRIVVIVWFVLLPVAMCLIVTDEFNNWFARSFGMTLHQFTLSRSTRISMLMESDEVKYGLGSTTVYLTKVYQEMHQSTIEQWNLHNDVVRIYMECGILGSVVFTSAYFKSVCFQRAPFVLMCYIFLESCVNHLFGAGSVQYWLLIYLAIAYAAETHYKEDSLRTEEIA